MELSQELFGYGLFLSSWRFIAVIFIIGYVFIDRAVFALSVLLYCFSIILNTYLKDLFQIPLNPDVFTTPGWAFPSGHTQALANVLIYICWHYRNVWLWLASLICFTVSTCSIVHFGYHNWIDILGGLAVAAFVVSSFILVRRSFPLPPYIWGGILTVATVLLSTFVIAQGELEYRHVWGVMSMAMAFYSGWLVFEREVSKKYSPIKMLLLVLANIAAITIFTFSMKFDLALPITILYALALGFWEGYIVIATYTSFKRVVPLIRRTALDRIRLHNRY